VTGACESRPAPVPGPLKPAGTSAHTSVCLFFFPAARSCACPIPVATHTHVAPPPISGPARLLRRPRHHIRVRGRRGLRSTQAELVLSSCGRGTPAQERTIQAGGHAADHPRLASAAAHGNSHSGKAGAGEGGCAGAVETLGAGARLVLLTCAIIRRKPAGVQG
jgi:hypothetical protein